MNDETESTKPECDILGISGNVFAIIGRVDRCLSDVGEHDKARDWKKAALECKSYDAVLQLMFTYVDPC